MRRIKMAVVGALALALVAMAAPAVAHDEGQLAFGHMSVATGPRQVGMVMVGACGTVAALGRYAAGVEEGIAYRFQVERATRGKRFTLAPFGTADIDIAFRGPGIQMTAFASASPSGESGRVPMAASVAEVCLVAGGPTSFVYTAG